MDILERNVNNQTDVNKNDQVIVKQVTVERAKHVVLDWLRDVKGPRGKRSMAIILSHWGHRFSAAVINLAIVQLIDENKVVCVRDQQAVGPVLSKSVAKDSLVPLSRCNNKDWIEYNRYPRKMSIGATAQLVTIADTDISFASTMKETTDTSDVADTETPPLHGGACSSSHPHPCIDLQCFGTRMRGKWSKGVEQEVDALSRIEQDTYSLEPDANPRIRQAAFRQPIREASNDYDEQLTDIED